MPLIEITNSNLGNVLTNEAQKLQTSESNRILDEAIDELNQSYKLDFDKKVSTNGANIYYLKQVNNIDTYFIFRSKEHVEYFKKIYNEQTTFFDNFLGFVLDSDVYIPLLPINMQRTNLEFEQFKSNVLDKTLMRLNISYQSNIVDIELLASNRDDDDLVRKYLNLLRLSFRFRARKLVYLKIKGFNNFNTESFEKDINELIISILFDIEYTYGYIFETISKNYGSRFNPKYKHFNNFPVSTESTTFTFKKYIPELIEYFHIGEQIDYPPFQFICYYHIIEYFLDKVAYSLVSDYLKLIVMKPDFHINSDKYVNDAVNFLKTQNNSHLPDKTKINRVLEKYITIDEIKEFIESNTHYTDELNQNILADYFSKDIKFNFKKTLSIKKLNLGNEKDFYNSLTARIYALRCSIVHSNPDFDETKAIPFISTPENLSQLRLEIELLNEISRIIISKSASIS
ncbi:hypothetical protein EOL70_18430 [Leucothrix sargassi]|nr:hypothetical protein EOL70_18430 [Leucothrix sargassi]